MAVKRPAPGGTPPPAAKARIAKSGPIAAKGASISKAPITKAPVTKSTAPSIPPKTPSPAGPPVAKAPVGAAVTSVGRSDSWKDFESSDPLYALIGQVSQDKIFTTDNVLVPERLDSYLDMLIVQQAAKKPKDWVEIWAAMDIPVTHQAVVLEPILAFGLQHAPETLGRILAELLKGHRIKTKTVEDAVAGAMKDMADTHGIIREMLFLIFPKGPQSEWGWSRVGWSWQEWWKITENCFASIAKLSAFDELAALLDKIEAEGKMPLSKQATVWNDMRLGKAKSLLCKLGELGDEADLVACLDATLK